VLAFIGFGKVVYYYLGVTHLANEGARLAAVSDTSLPDGTSTSLGAYICSKLASSDSGVDKALVVVSYQDPANITPGQWVSVKITTKYHLIPYFGAASIPVNGSATMRVESSPVMTKTTVIGPESHQCT
jgi:hypothetical protein